MTGAEPLDAALAYAQRGWRVLPVYSAEDGGRCTCEKGRECDSPGKHPRTRRGGKDATTDEGQIKEWWTEWPEANVGIATGEQSGLLVFDVDPRHGGDKSLAGFEAEHGHLPLTPKVSTGGGGCHLYFQYPSGGASCRVNWMTGSSHWGAKRTFGMTPTARDTPLSR